MTQDKYVKKKRRKREHSVDGRILTISSNFTRTRTSIIASSIDRGRTMVGMARDRRVSAGIFCRSFLDVSSHSREAFAAWLERERSRERRAHGPKELVLLRRVVKLDAMRAFSETSLWNANTWGRVGACTGTIRTILRLRSTKLNFTSSVDAIPSRLVNS